MDFHKNFYILRNISEGLTGDRVMIELFESANCDGVGQRWTQFS